MLFAEMVHLFLVLFSLTVVLSPCNGQRRYVMFGNIVPDIQENPTTSFSELLRQRFDTDNAIQQVGLIFNLTLLGIYSCVFINPRVIKLLIISMELVMKFHNCLVRMT